MTPRSRISVPAAFAASNRVGANREKFTLRASAENYKRQAAASLLRWARSLAWGRRWLAPAGGGYIAPRLDVLH